MTIAEIASLAGVSRGTVDRVVNNRGSVCPEKRQIILDFIEENGFVPNKAGKTLAVRKKNLKLGFILFNSTNNPFFLDLEEGIESFVRDYSAYGVEVYREYTSISDSQSQLEAIKRLKEKGISGLAITPIEESTIKEELLSLKNDGIPVVTVNSDLPDSGRLLYVGSDYRKAGETAAGILGLLTGGQGHVGIVIGSRSVLCHTEREKGFRSILERSYPALCVTETVLNKDDDVLSEEVTAHLLENPELDALYLASGGTVGAVSAIRKSGRKVTVVSHDINASSSVFIKEGLIKPSIFQDPFLQGRRPLKVLFEKLAYNQDPQEPCCYTKSEIIIRENLEEFRGKEGKNE
ncbi:MAG: LacI family DNA-binding transcriptional regulator [Spirochaetales bacterium]|nr:LacI family DNA-binding transcriptional regulator [Candidatus Physcosoma equi]